MRVLELSLRNYRVFEEVDLEFPARVIGIFGPNGSGKSTLVESLRFALYGRTRTPKDQIRTGGVLTDCAVRLVFQHGGQQYEIRRLIKGKNHAIEAELSVGDLQLAVGVRDVEEEIRRLLRMDDQVFRASVFAEQKQLDAFSDVTKGKRTEMVLRLLGIRPVDDARTVARKEARDVKGTAERLAGSLPDLTAQEEDLTAARGEARDAGAAAGEAAAALTEAETRATGAHQAFEASDRVRERVERIEVERRSKLEQAEGLETRRSDLAGRIAGLRKDLEELRTIEEQAAALEGAAERLAAARRAAEAQEEARILDQELEGLPDVDVETALGDLQTAEAALRDAERAATRAESARETLEAQLGVARDTLTRAGDLDPSAPCPTCGQELGDGFESYVDHCRAEVARLQKEESAAARALRAASTARGRAEKELAAARRAGEEARSVVQSRRSLEDRLGKARARLEELARPFDGAVPDLGELEAQAVRAAELSQRLVELRAERKRLAEIEGDLGGAERELKACRSRIEELDRQAAGLGFDPEDHDRLLKERDEAARLLEDARAAERRATTLLNAAEARVKELQAEIRKVKEIAGRVGELRDDARHLAKVSDLLDGFRDHLVARIGPELSREAEALFRDLTNHEYEDLKIDEDTLAINIADAGSWFGMERFSGSETDLANLALRAAISTHLSRMSGADVGMMVLDEVLASLDVERKDLFVQAMGKLADRFNQLFVITHAEQVKDQFPAQIEVRKVGRRRSIAELR
jgi:DNA repair protein SbcC/Rad50